MLFHDSRRHARTGPAGELILLSDQDRSRWDRSRIEAAGALMARAAALGRIGPYQLEAAIAAVHCEAPSWEATDFAQLLGLYSLLAAIDPSPVVRLNRAVVLAQVEGPAAALADVEQLEGALERYHLFHATRAAFLRGLGRDEEARAADRRALARTANPVERALLTARLADG